MMDISISKPKVLVIDEDLVYQSVMSDLLSEHMNISFASNFTEASKEINNNEYSMIISESEISDINVVDLIKKFKLMQANLYFVIITAKRDMNLAIEVMKNGAVDYLLKPFTVEDIANLVEKYLKFSVNKKFDYDLINIISEEKRSFTLPTNVHILNPFVYELMEMIKRFNEINRNDIFSLRLAIYEMLINAVEHGNLGINYEKKKNLLSTGINYIEYLDSLCKIEPYNQRKIEISYHFLKQSITFNIKDEGDGFDVNKFENRDIKSDLLALHGRGIIISKFNMDKIIYNDKGNEVQLIKYLNTKSIN
ncbi:MAG: ATP-binding protein [Spirochaetia bacterium]|nr:ATP-binding protein [Spirochaetia bacterium]